MIKFENVSKVYDNGFQAVKSLNFEIQKGELLVLIGPSGSGKSTTMKMINRINPHSSGKITINGKDITSYNVAELRRNIGYVIQQIGLFPHYTIEKNIAIVPQLKGWDEKDIKTRVKELTRNSRTGSRSSCDSLSERTFRRAATTCRNCKGTCF